MVQRERQRQHGAGRHTECSGGQAVQAIEALASHVLIMANRANTSLEMGEARVEV